MANNAFKRKIKKLTDLRLKEISGVDHPASLHEGWAVIKNSDNELNVALAEIIEPNPDSLETNVDTDVMQEEEEAVQETQVEEIVEVESTELAKELNDVRKELSDTKAKLVDIEENSALEKAVRDAQRWAIVPQLDPVEFAPVLRSMRSTVPDASQKVEEIFDAVAVALGEAGILKEIGSDGSPEHEDSYGPIEAMAKAMGDDGSASSLSDGIAKVAVENPELYSAYVAEMGA